MKLTSPATLATVAAGALGAIVLTGCTAGTATTGEDPHQKHDSAAEMTTAAIADGTLWHRNHLSGNVALSIHAQNKFADTFRVGSDHKTYGLCEADLDTKNYAIAGWFDGKKKPLTSTGTFTVKQAEAAHAACVTAWTKLQQKNG